MDCASIRRMQAPVRIVAPTALDDQARIPLHTAESRSLCDLTARASIVVRILPTSHDSACYYDPSRCISDQSRILGVRPDTGIDAFSIGSPLQADHGRRPQS